MINDNYHSFKTKHNIFTQRPLELIHLYLSGPTGTESIRVKRYSIVIVDDFTRWTWVKFLSHNFQRFGAHTMFREGHPLIGDCPVI